MEGPVQDLISPLDWSIASTSIADAYGFTTLPHLRDMAITGPLVASGVSDTPSRRRIFSCQPKTGPQEIVCARQIVSRLASQAFRARPTERDSERVDVALQTGRGEGGFESGVRMALEGVLASPRFVFRFEERPADATARLLAADTDLASRLSYFLWATLPDADLRARPRRAAANGGGMERQARRLLADRRSDVLSSRFAAQWLRLQDLDKINPDVRTYPDFDEQLKRRCARNRAALRTHPSRGSPGLGAVHRRLHVRRRAPGEALPDSERRRQRVPQGALR
jgi:hypothetical protein